MAITQEVIRILLADQHALFREAVRTGLENEGDLRVVAQARSGPEAVVEADRTVPHIAIVDADLPSGEAAATIAELKARLPRCGILVLGADEDPRRLVDLLDAGANGYLTKEAPLAELVDATRAIHGGDTLDPQRMLGPLLAALLQRRREQDHAHDRLSRLTRREREVLALLASGADNESIAAVLVISPQTARTHIQNILGKLAVHSRLEAAAFVTQNGSSPMWARRMSEVDPAGPPPDAPLALVTGAAGFVGSHLVERLLADGWRVRAVDALTDYYDPERKGRMLDALRALPGCEALVADLRTTDPGPLLHDVRVVFHQAGQPGVRASWDRFDSYVEHNIVATQRLLDGCAGTGIERFVYASSSSVYGDAETYPTREDDLPRPRSPYGVTKLAAEHLCGVYAANLAVPTVSLRYFTVFGPRQRPDMAMHRMIEACLDGTSFPLYGDGTAIRDFTYVADVVAANLAAATRPLPPGTVVNVAGGTDASVRHVMDIVERLTGNRLVVETRAFAPGDVTRTGGARERAAKLLGWSPRVGLDEGLAHQVAWHRSLRDGGA